MNTARVAKLEAKGWRSGSAAEFLDLSREEADFVKLRLRRAAEVKKQRTKVEKEVDGRWIAAIDPVGALAYGATKAEAIRKAKAIAMVSSKPGLRRALGGTRS